MLTALSQALRPRTPALLILGVGAALAGSASAGPPPYSVRYLVSNGAVLAEHMDPNLVNPWGIAFNPVGYAWVSDADSGVSTLYDGNGVPQPLVVSIPGPDGTPGAGAPTGIVYYGGDGFLVGTNGKLGPARFMWATEGGTIAAWSPDVDPTNAINVVDATPFDAGFKGLTIDVGLLNGEFIYAADFHNAMVRVYDSLFVPVLIPGAFRDPDMPEGFAPFGIQAIDHTIYVAYAMQDADKEEEVPGAHLGYVDAYDAQGALLRRVISEGKLNAPWGIAIAPDNFGLFSGALLIGNFGDGRINAYDPGTGVFRGMVRDEDGSPIEIEGLWGITFGNGVHDQPTNTLFFAAGINDEADGLYGSISVSGCYPDLDGNGTLEIFDFLTFTNLFNEQDPAADCDSDGAFDLFDFLCFTNAFNAGC